MGDAFLYGFLGLLAIFVVVCAVKDLGGLAQESRQTGRRNAFARVSLLVVVGLVVWGLVHVLRTV